MALKKYKPNTHSQRGLVLVARDQLWSGKPVKTLTVGLTKTGGRNNNGRVTARRRGGGHKRLYREIDFKRRNFDMPAIVERRTLLSHPAFRSKDFELVMHTSRPCVAVHGLTPSSITHAENRQQQ